MSNRQSSFGAPTPALPHRSAGHIDAMAELAISQVGDIYVLEGNLTIKTLPALPEGTSIWLRCTGTPTFTNSASLICQGGTDIVAATGDLILVLSRGDGAWSVFVFSAGGALATIAPQGRLTLASGVSVMQVSQAAKTTIFYTPHAGCFYPRYNGAKFIPTKFSELSIATTDTANSPAAIGASKVNDWFLWQDSTGVNRLVHGPDWTNDTTRSAGTALVMIDGILLNNVAITNGPDVQRGTYVGTTRSNASSQLDFIFGTSGSSGVAGVFNVWNAYYRVNVACSVVDTAATYTYTTFTTRQAHASATMQVSFVIGLAEDAVWASYTDVVLGAATSASARVGLGFDSTTVFSKSGSFVSYAAAVSGTIQGQGIWNPGIGAHYVAALQISDGTNASNFNLAGAASINGLDFMFRM